MWRRDERVKELDAVYSVSSEGVVYSGGLPLKAVRGEWVSLHGERRYVSYLVARAFVPNAEGRRYVVHVNGDRTDNRAANLAWSDSEEPGGKRGPKPRLVPVVQYSLDGEKLCVFANVIEASERTGVAVGRLRAVLAKGGGRSGGYFWRYL